MSNDVKTTAECKSVLFTGGWCVQKARTRARFNKLLKYESTRLLRKTSGRITVPWSVSQDLSFLIEEPMKSMSALYTQCAIENGETLFLQEKNQ